LNGKSQELLFLAFFDIVSQRTHEVSVTIFPPLFFAGGPSLLLLEEERWIAFFSCFCFPPLFPRACLMIADPTPPFFLFSLKNFVKIGTTLFPRCGKSYGTPVSGLVLFSSMLTQPATPPFFSFVIRAFIMLPPFVEIEWSGCRPFRCSSFTPHPWLGRPDLAMLDHRVNIFFSFVFAIS